MPVSTAGKGDIVSIHAPRAGRVRPVTAFEPLPGVSIHAPRAGRVPSPSLRPLQFQVFQSTRPARGASLTGYDVMDGSRFQSTRPARGASSGDYPCLHLTSVSIHAPRAGRVYRPTPERCEAVRFQSTRPARGASVLLHMVHHAPFVSIHAPRAGRVDATLFAQGAERSFNPRAPRGARLARSRQVNPVFAFQSTRPARGASRRNREEQSDAKFQSTRPARGASLFAQLQRVRHRVSIHAPRAGRVHSERHLSSVAVSVSIHAPRAGRVAQGLDGQWHATEFQSTRPARGASEFLPPFELVIGVSIHAPRAGRVIAAMFMGNSKQVSIHAPRAGRVREAVLLHLILSGFNPRAPRGARPAGCP